MRAETDAQRGESVYLESVRCGAESSCPARVENGGQGGGEGGGA